ncbi:hypothetical protein NQ314_010509 [Rhamnusium bicolor]|uniref:Uncharacterized protein n=1 Tax=Rhamnusium bicolor TaxID=1586634 RepID=A0AAV8XR11_9CUCU|nr:hypothetical protein NQ314_010509 [Rhamnusium bicolor]
MRFKIIKKYFVERFLKHSVNAPEDWAGRFWARTWCDTNTNHCLTGDCGNKLQCEGNGGAPPATLAEITLKGSNGLDFYDISLVDGFNTLVTVSMKFIIFD